MATLLVTLLVTLFVLGALPAAAQETSDGAEGEPTTGRLTGHFNLGFRSVDVSGNDGKYEEDFGYEDGPRLFDFEVSFEPEAGARGIADRIELAATNLGGDPFETIRLQVRKHGAYDFRFDRRKSHYFYEDTLVPPELASPSLSNGGDFHTFDFDRIRDTAKLDITLGPQAKLFFGFERFTRKGESTTTIDIQRDEFEFDRPIDESMNEYQAGFQYKWSKATLFVEERVRDYENAVEIFLPGLSQGENTDNVTVLDYYFLDQPYDFTSYDHRARLILSPTSKLQITLAGLVQSLDMDVDAEESVAGTGFSGAPFATEGSGEGEVERDTQLLDIDLSYLVTDNFSIIGRAWSKNLDQDGQFDFVTVPGGTDENVGRWEIDTTGGQAGVRWWVNKELTVSGGLHYETRDVTHGWDTDGDVDDVDEESTDAEGFFFHSEWRPAARFNMSLGVEKTSFDDPFTLSSPSDRLRTRARALFVLGPGRFLLGTYKLTRIENDQVDFRADTDQAGLQLVFIKPKWKGLFGIGTIQIERDVDQTVTTLPGFGGGAELFFPIYYEIDSTFLDGHFHYNVNDRFALGTDVRFYDNGGSFGMSRNDLRGYLETTLGRYTARLGYRTIDYDEDDAAFDDYDADILELSIGYRW